MIRQLANRRNTEYILTLLDEIINRIHISGPVSASDFEKLALIKLFHPYIFLQKETEILYLTGLFYKVDKPKSIIEEVYSIFADTIVSETGIRFTPVQADAYRNIREKQFFSFSAPTSAGKSFLFRELITNTDGDIVIVVPSRALIAEYLSTVKDLVDSSVLVLQFIENINIAKTSRRVFIITPERGGDLFKYQDNFSIQLFLFDEAQLSEEDIRGIGFDAFVRRVSTEFQDASKVFAHPFVQNPEAQLNKHHFPKQDSSSSAYEQNAVGKVFITIDEGELYYFSPYENAGTELVRVKRDLIKEIMERHGTILIYTSKGKLYSKKYIHDYRGYLKFCPKLRNIDALKYVDQLRDYIGASKSGEIKSSLIVRLMERGIVVHHGSMPLKMRLIIEEFVRSNHARICFATSTLKQGINMPFDAVFIDNYNKMDVLTLKNLIGRAGRTTKTPDVFEFGFTLIEQKHLSSFCKRINEIYQLKDVSALESEIENISEDNKDLVEAIKTNTFENETRLTQTQLDRLKSNDIDKSVEYVLDHILTDDRILTGKEYYEKLKNSQRQNIKNALKTIYISHLRRSDLTPVEQSILSTAIPILLWHIQGKTFKEVLALRYAYLTQLTERRKIKALVREEGITSEEADKRIEMLKVRFSQAPTSLPNINARRYSDFSNNTPVLQLDYDTLVFDTYDYIDKVISLSLSDPLCAAFKLYYERTSDIRASIICNYIRYGTNDLTEIWLLRYGFAFEDITWIKPFVLKIDEQMIEFSPSINYIETDRFEIIRRYL